MNAEEIFHAALAKPASERPAFLADACAGDDPLRRRIEALLEAHENPGSFLAGQPPMPASTIDHSPPAEQPGAVIGPYKLIEPIGEGGMGTVWMAQQTEPVKRLVALKLIKAGMDSKQIIARFEAERQALALMDHPNIAKVFDGGTTSRRASVPACSDDRTSEDACATGRPFFVMELVKGQPITKYCDEHHLTPRQRLELFVPVCQAIQHAHQKGIIHRDLKPSNVLVALYDGRPVPKVIDFGVAKATGVQLTDATLVTGFGAIVGTLEYMSPEQAEVNQLDIDTRSDIYSLGVMLYELLTGSPPFTRKDLEKAGMLEMLRVIREQEPSKPSTKLSNLGSRVAPQRDFASQSDVTTSLASIAANRGTEPAKLTRLVRGELDWIVMKALEKDRNRRYETANGFAMDVQRYLADEAVLACPPSVGYRVRKFVRRNRPQVIGASLVFVALVAGVVGTTWGLVEAKDQERVAEKAAEEERQAKVREAQRAEGERLANEQTRKRLAQIEKGMELFAGILQGINPREEELGVEPLYVQLRQRAEKAADALDAEAVGDPLAVARLQTILGDTLRELGSYAKAVEVLEKARAIREQEPGADHPDTLTTLNNLALAYQAAGRLPEAIALFERVRDGSVKKPGANHPDTLFTLGNLAAAYREAGRLPEAITLLEQVRDAFAKTGGADHPDTLTTLNNLAMAYQDAGRLPEAIALFEQVRDASVKKPGADHPSTLITLNNLAAAYQYAGRLPEAIAVFEQVRDAQIKKLGAGHADTVTTLHNLAMAYLFAGSLSKAVAHLEQAATGIAKLKFRHRFAGRIIGDTILAYEAAGQLDKVEGWRRQWLVVVKENSGANSPAYAGELAALGLNLLKQKKWFAAEPLLRESLGIREKTEPNAWTTFNTQSMLGGSLLSQKKYKDAEPLLLKGYEGMKAREKTIPPQAVTRIPEALDRLIELYTATDKPEEAKKWRAERAKYPNVAPPPREKK